MEGLLLPFWFNRDFKFSWILQPVIIWDNQELNGVTYNNVLHEQYEIYSYVTVWSDCMVWPTEQDWAMNQWPWQSSDAIEQIHRTLSSKIVWRLVEKTMKL